MLTLIQIIPTSNHDIRIHKVGVMFSPPTLCVQTNSLGWRIRSHRLVSSCLSMGNLTALRGNLIWSVNKSDRMCWDAQMNWAVLPAPVFPLWCWFEQTNRVYSSFSHYFSPVILNPCVACKCKVHCFSIMQIFFTKKSCSQSTGKQTRPQSKQRHMLVVDYSTLEHHTTLFCESPSVSFEKSQRFMASIIVKKSGWAPVD